MAEWKDTPCSSSVRWQIMTGHNVHLKVLQISRPWTRHITPESEEQPISVPEAVSYRFRKPAIWAALETGWHLIPEGDYAPRTWSFTRSKMALDSWTNTFFLKQKHRGYMWLQGRNRHAKKNKTWWDGGRANPELSRPVSPYLITGGSWQMDSLEKLLGWIL